MSRCCAWVRATDKYGQQLLVPEIKIEGWWTSLGFEAETIIALYADHGTSEQYHSEFQDRPGHRASAVREVCHQRTDSCLCPTRLQSLRWLGQNGLLGPDAPLRHRAKRRRLRTVMQELIYLAARLIYRGRRWQLAFGYGLSGGAHLSTTVRPLGGHLIAISAGPGQRRVHWAAWVF